MKIDVTVELGKKERRLIASMRSERFGEHARSASRKQCRDAILDAIGAFLAGLEADADAAAREDEGGD